jgi:predicted Zn-dependent protease
MYMLLSGERMSGMMRRLILTGLHDGPKSTAVADMTCMKAIMNDAVAGNFAEGYAAYLKLPEKYRQQKFIAIVALNCLQQLEGRDAEYDQFIAEFRKTYPGDPCIDLLSIDHYKTRQQPEKALDAIRAVDRWCGGDLYLSYLEGDLLYDLDRIDEAAKLAAKLRVGAPKEVWGYTLSVILAFREKKWAVATQTLQAQVMARNKPIDLPGLEENEYYAEYVKTKEYAELKKWQAARKK